MSTQNSTDHDSQQVEARRDVSLWENTDGWWLVHLGEPDATDDDESAGVFDDLFTRIADPARLGARTR
jgi:hypothetical protein